MTKKPDDKKPGDMFVDLTKVEDDNALLKIFEMEWQDHFQTRKQTWQALQISAVLTVAIVGIQWKVAIPIVSLISSALLIGVSLFGMQITFRHRNVVEREKFAVINKIEEHFHFKADGFRIPVHITILDIFKFWKSNTSLFLLRMQLFILILGVIMFVFAMTHPVPLNTSC